MKKAISILISMSMVMSMMCVSTLAVSKNQYQGKNHSKVEKAQAKNNGSSKKFTVCQRNVVIEEPEVDEKIEETVVDEKIEETIVDEKIDQGLVDDKFIEIDDGLSTYPGIETRGLRVISFGR